MADDRVFVKCAWRLMPLIIALYVFNYMDRTNVGFAALTMNKDLGFSPSVYGLGAGILFVTFALFQVPANIILDRIGARRWMFCILAVWGAISTSNAFLIGVTLSVAAFGVVQCVAQAAISFRRFSNRSPRR
jgi:ACS family tartrate transporter-like MFS transporter